MAFAGLVPTLVKVRLPQPELKEIDPSRDAMLINLRTGEIIQTVAGGTKEPPPAGFVDLRGLTDEKFEQIIDKWRADGMPDDMIGKLREYREQRRSRTTKR